MGETLAVSAVRDRAVGEDVQRIGFLAARFGISAEVLEEDSICSLVVAGEAKVPTAIPKSQ
jgi:hypothetical protein